jgi:hypothetical protein
MSAEVVYSRTADGWDVHAIDCKDVVVRTVGARITVATIADDETPPTETPLAVSLGEPETVTA